MSTPGGGSGPDDAQERARLRDIARGGVCGTCRHARLVSTPRGSAFLRCLHPKMPKYPPQPLWRCAYLEPADPQA